MRRRFFGVVASVLAMAAGTATVNASAVAGYQAADAEADAEADAAADADDRPPLRRQGFPPDCPSTADSFDMQNAAAYQVFGQIDYVDQNTGQPMVHHMFIGTAWAVGERLLATNAHVTGAYTDAAQQGVQFSRAIAVQSGTGEVIRLLRALTHPDYNGNPLGSPDVGLFTSQEKLTTILPLAPDDSVLDLGDEFQLTGFPGDVDEFLTVVPGQIVPQATSLSGHISARRSHDPTRAVDLDTLDVYQHQAPTTPGTSGSAMVYCGMVFAINNAGTVQMIVSPGPNGEYVINRQAAAANNFGVHVRHIRELVELFEANAVQGFELPVPAVIQPQTGGGGGGTTGGIPPGGGGGGGGGGVSTQPRIVTLAGTAGTDPQHQFQFDVDLGTGEIIGMSVWGANQFTLYGMANLDTGEFNFMDNAQQVNPSYPVGYYFGYIDQSGNFEGYYTEDSVTTYPIAGGLAT